MALVIAEASMNKSRFSFVYRFGALLYFRLTSRSRLFSGQRVEGFGLRWVEVGPRFGGSG